MNSRWYQALTLSERKVIANCWNAWYLYSEDLDAITLAFADHSRLLQVLHLYFRRHVIFAKLSHICGRCGENKFPKFNAELRFCPTCLKEIKQAKRQKKWKSYEQRMVAGHKP